MSGRQVSRVVTSSGHSRESHEAMKPNSDTVSSGALLSGNTMVVRKRRWPQPSMQAASHSSTGRRLKNCRSRKMLKALAMNGTVSPCRVFSHEPPGSGITSPRMTRKLGSRVMASGIIMVLSRPKKITSRPANCRRAKA